MKKLSDGSDQSRWCSNKLVAAAAMLLNCQALKIGACTRDTIGNKREVEKKKIIFLVHVQNGTNCVAGE